MPAMTFSSAVKYFLGAIFLGLALMVISGLIEGSTILAQIGLGIIAIVYVFFSVKVRSEFKNNFPEVDYVDN